MSLLKDDYLRIEKIDGAIYNTSPSGGFMHSQINANLYHAIRQQLNDSICVVSVENLDLYLSVDEYVIPDIIPIAFHAAFISKIFINNFSSNYI